MPFNNNTNIATHVFKSATSKSNKGVTFWIDKVTKCLMGGYFVSCKTTLRHFAGSHYHLLDPFSIIIPVQISEADTCVGSCRIFR